MQASTSAKCVTINNKVFSKCKSSVVLPNFITFENIVVDPNSIPIKYLITASAIPLLTRFQEGKVIEIIRIIIAISFLILALNFLYWL